MARGGTRRLRGGFGNGFRIGAVLGAVVGVALAALMPVVVLAATAVAAALWLAGRTRSAITLDCARVSHRRRRSDD